MTCTATAEAEKTHCSFTLQPACHATAVHQFMPLGAGHLDRHDFLQSLLLILVMIGLL